MKIPERTLLSIGIVLFVCMVSVEGGSVGRVRRNAFQLCSFINHYTHRSCLNYNPYGCFCGYGQQGTQPVDETDRCCKEHDDCYGEVHTRNHCYFWSGLFVGYNNECQDGDCWCTDDEKCSRKVCECDLQLAKCLKKASYDPGFAHFDRRQCK